MGVGFEELASDGTAQMERREGDYPYFLAVNL